MEYVFGYIVISSNSILAIMKWNRNGISLFLKRKITGPTVAAPEATSYCAASDVRWPLGIILCNLKPLTTYDQ